MAHLLIVWSSIYRNWMRLVVWRPPLYDPSFSRVYIDNDRKAKNLIFECQEITRTRRIVLWGVIFILCALIANQLFLGDIWLKGMKTSSLLFFVKKEISNYWPNIKWDPTIFCNKNRMAHIVWPGRSRFLFCLFSFDLSERALSLHLSTLDEKRFESTGTKCLF